MKRAPNIDKVLMNASEAPVRTQISDHIGLILLNRPAKRNAVNGPLAEALDRAVKDMEANADVHVIILASVTEGKQYVFSAGADLSEVANGRGATLNTVDGGFAGFVHHARSKPWIAAIGTPKTKLGDINFICPLDFIRFIYYHYLCLSCLSGAGFGRWL